MSRAKGPPPEQRIREAEAGYAGTRDMTPAVGKRGEPGRYRRAVEGAKVALAKPRWGDARWSYLYDKDTRYAATADDEQVAAANRRARGGEAFPEVNGPIIHAPVWTWEIPVYFWFGGIAGGSSLIALACDVAGDEDAAKVARKVALGAVATCPPLLIMDLGRPTRFLNMLRVFKPRSPMSLGAWCLAGFSTVNGAAVGADLIGRDREARWLGRLLAYLGLYLGSYTGALLAATAVPVWARSRDLLGPLFVCTATATGAASNRLVLAAIGVPPDHPTRRALGTIETAAMTAELALSSLNEHRLGELTSALDVGPPAGCFRAAKWAVRIGLALRLGGRREPRLNHVTSALFLFAGLMFRFAWVGAGKPSARDHVAVARMHREPGAGRLRAG